MTLIQESPRERRHTVPYGHENKEGRRPPNRISSVRQACQGRWPGWTVVVLRHRWIGEDKSAHALRLFIWCIIRPAKFITRNRCRVTPFMETKSEEIGTPLLSASKENEKLMAMGQLQIPALNCRWTGEGGPEVERNTSRTQGLV